MRRLPLIVLLLLVLVATALPTQAASRPPTPPPAGSPSFNAPSPQEAERIARAYLRDNAANLGITAADAATFVVGDRTVSRQNGLTFLYMQQAFNEIYVYNASVKFGILPDGSVLHVGNRAIGNLAASINTATPTTTPEDAVRQAAADLGLAQPQGLTRQQETGGPTRAVVLSDGGISLEAIPVQLAYQPVADGAVRLAWDVTIYELSALHWWSVRVDAVTGQVLDKADWVVNEQMTPELQMQRDSLVSQPALAVASDVAAVAPANAPFTPDAYRVFALPAESPNHTTPPTPADGRTLVNNPADTTASPFGWHDTDGVAGAEFTITRGNNVHAGLDLAAPNGVDAGSEPDGGATLTFDNPIDLTQPPTAYRPAVVTNLFYWNNIIHDVTYQYGFDEESRNFQQNNYGNGGVGNDYVRAEGQDYSGTNNANFATPPDGQPPRMQMYIWTPPLTVTVEILSPAGLAGIYYGSQANFGPDITGEGITGTIAIATDGTAPDPFDACEDITNTGDVAGKIALVNRGNCTFPIKVQNAQDAGALAVIIVNNLPTQPGPLGGTAPAITIPSTHIYKTLGDNIRATIAGGDPVTANIRDDDLPIVNRDSDLDAGVITHEYTHGISNRLTGPPYNAGCLQNEEQMGEGWSDLYALMYTADGNDTAVQPRGIGTYLTFEPTNGLGIRPAPYSLDLNVNSYTYANRADSIISVPHGLGFIWASMVWDMYWNMRQELGYDADLYNGTGGNNLAIQIVTDGLKLQPCSPGFVDGRDAIIDAATANGMSDDQVCRLIWSAFSRRGLGFSATQGSSDDRTDGTAAFDMPPTCSVTAISLNTLGVTPGMPILPVAALALVALVGVGVALRRRNI